MSSDLDLIMQVMEAAFDPAFGEAWNRSQVESALALSNTHLMLAPNPETGLGIAGFVMSRSVLDEEELLLIAVKPEYRGRGIAKTMIADLFENALKRNVTRIFLEMREGNPAEKLYRIAGFQPIGRRQAYYTSPTGDRLDAITFSCKIDNL